MQSDPVGLEGGENGFVYVGGNPLVRVDASGQFWDTVADIGFMIYDAASGAYHYATGDDEAFKTDMAALAADSAAAVVPFATGAGLAVRRTKAYEKYRAGKLKHFFGQERHKLDGFLKTFKSEEEAYDAVQNAIEKIVEKNGIVGRFEETVNVSGYPITVRGFVDEDGITKIGTFFIK